MRKNQLCPENRLQRRPESRLRTKNRRLLRRKRKNRLRTKNQQQLLRKRRHRAKAVSGGGTDRQKILFSTEKEIPTQRQKAATFPFAATASCGANKPHQPIPLPPPVPRLQTEQPIHIRQHKQKPRRQKADRTAASDC